MIAYLFVILSFSFLFRDCFSRGRQDKSYKGEKSKQVAKWQYYKKQPSLTFDVLLSETYLQLFGENILLLLVSISSTFYAQL